VETLLRIGELSKRSGVSPELLRAWERRYGLLEPRRSAGGLRLYGLDDLERVRRMRQHLSDGLAAAEAAALARSPAAERGIAPSPGAGRFAAARRELADALLEFDEPRAQSVLDGVLAAGTTETLLTEVVLPYLRELGERWDRGELSVAEEHFASSVIRGRLLGLARGWGRGLGPLALLACLPGEHHELGLIAFGLALRGRGLRVAYLGADTPVGTILESARSLQPAVVVVAAVTEARLIPVVAELHELASSQLLVIGGSAADTETARELDAVALALDPVEAAERVVELLAVGAARRG
jgi:MerR family transcriptional regulator, light-induced transcriptional regulator